MEPLTTSDRSTSASGRRSSTSISSPSPTSAEPMGTQVRPSARARELSTPAPRRSGVATRAFPSRARRSRIHSSLAGVERSATAAVARTRGRGVTVRPLSSASSGTPNSSNASAAETG